MMNPEEAASLVASIQQEKKLFQQAGEQLSRIEQEFDLLIARELDSDVVDFAKIEQILFDKQSRIDELVVSLINAAQNNATN